MKPKGASELPVGHAAGQHAFRRRVKADLASSTLSSLKPLVVESFSLSCSPADVLLCHENSDIINSDFAALTLADVTDKQAVPLSDLGLKRGSFIYAAWPEEDVDISTAPAVPLSGSHTAPPAGASERKTPHDTADPVAFGMRNAAPVAGATYVDPPTRTYAQTLQHFMLQVLRCCRCHAAAAGGAAAACAPSVGAPRAGPRGVGQAHHCTTGDNVSAASSTTPLYV